VLAARAALCNCSHKASMAAVVSGGSASRGMGQALISGSYPDILVLAFSRWEAAMKRKKLKVVSATLGVAVLAMGGVLVYTGAAGAPHSSESTLHTELLSDSQSLVKTPTNNGYWLVTADGQVYTFGSAKSYGTLPTSHITPNKPIVGMVATSTAKGYWLVGSDGGVFSFGAAKFFGSKGGTKINSPVVGMTALPARGIEWDGNYDTATTYTKGDAVSQDGSTYVSLRTTNMGNTPAATLTVDWALVAAKGTVGPVGATGATGAVGATGKMGVGVLNGTSAPTANVGVTGDFYLDTASEVLYGPKTGGAWPTSGTSLVGPAGENGVDGANGTDGINGKSILNGTSAPTANVGVTGDFYLDTTSEVLYGPKAGGVWPTSGTSLVGPKGTTGSAGATGPAGVGYDFQTATGNPVSVALPAGTYFVDVEFAVTDDSTEGTVAVCTVDARNTASNTHVGLFSNVIGMTQLANGAESISGILKTDRPATLLRITCSKLTEAALTVSDVRWWYSPIG